MASVARVVVAVLVFIIVVLALAPLSQGGRVVVVGRVVRGSAVIAWATVFFM